MSRCACPSLYADLLAGWAAALSRRLVDVLPAEGCPSVLLRAGCGRGCALRTLLRLRLSGEFPARWAVRAAPPFPGSVDGPASPGDGPLLLAASTVFLTTDRLVSTNVPPALLAPDIRRVYFPPLALWRAFHGRLVGDPLPALEVFAVLVADGMGVLEALSSSVDLTT